MLVVLKIYPFVSIPNHIASTRILLRPIINQPLKPFNIIWRYCKSLLKMFTKTEQHTSLWICKCHYNALGTPTSSSMMFGSPVMTVCDEKSTCLPMRLPCRWPSLPFSQEHITSTSLPDFCMAWGIPAMSLSIYMAMWINETVGSLHLRWEMRDTLRVWHKDRVMNDHY